MDNRPQRRFSGPGAAEQVDKRIFKARCGVGYLQRRHVAMLLDFLNARVLFRIRRTDLPGSPVANLRQLQRPLQQAAVVLLRAGDRKLRPAMVCVSAVGSP